MDGEANNTIEFTSATIVVGGVSDADQVLLNHSANRRRRRLLQGALRGRRAITLVEIMVVVAVSSVVLSVVVAVLVALMQKDREIRSFVVRSERQGDLAEMLRVDIRRAREVSLAAQSVLLIVAPDERQARYELTAGGCRRIVEQVGRAKPSIDFFAIGPAVAWALELGPAGQRPLYAVSLHRMTPTSTERPEPMPFLVYAALGADLR